MPLSQLEDNFPKELGTSAHFLSPSSSSLFSMTYLNDTLTLALGNYNGNILVNRIKRGLINVTGQFSCRLYGTAVNEDVVELREKFNRLTSFASARNKLT